MLTRVEFEEDYLDSCEYLGSIDSKEIYAWDDRLYVVNGDEVEETPDCYNPLGKLIDMINEAEVVDLEEWNKEYIANELEEGDYPEEEYKGVYEYVR